MKYMGLLISDHKVKDASSKERASESLVNWQRVELTAEQWCEQLSLGKTIQPSRFTSKPDGTFTHTKEFWQETSFICADADNIKGVEFDKEGVDKNPNGVEPWTDSNGLSQLYPKLKDRVYAVAQSVSSMTKDKGEPHRRYRLIFVFDTPIESEDHYHAVLLALAEKFPIIPAVTRSPAQPVFGNARGGFSEVHICGNVLKLADFPLPEPTPKPTPKSNLFDAPDETLEQFLQRHGVSYTPTKEARKYWVECPYKEGHSSGKNGTTDAYVFDDGSAWSFYCAHATCKSKGLATWEAFKRGYGIETKPAPTGFPSQKRDFVSDPPLPKKDVAPERLAPVFPDDDGSLFPGGLEFLYKAFWGTTAFCKPYLLAMGLTAIGVCTGRKAFVTVDGDTKGSSFDFPNAYSLLIGETTVAAKSECRQALHDLLWEVDAFKTVNSISSREGLAAVLRTDGDGDCDEWTEGDFTEGVRCLLSLDEVKSLFVASRREVTGNIPAELNDLWSCPRDASVRTRNNPIGVDYPVVNIFGCSTPNWLQKAVIGADIDGGFVNRFMPFLHEKMPYIRKKSHDVGSYNAFVSMLRELITTPAGGAKHYTFEDDAAVVYHDWAESRYNAAYEDPASAAITARIADQARRIALAFALATNGSCDLKISLELWQKACQVAEYLSEVAIFVFSEVGRDSDAVLERKILEKLAELGNEAKASEILQSFASRERPAAKVFHSLLEGLLRADVIDIVGTKPKIIRRVG